MSVSCTLLVRTVGISQARHRQEAAVRTRTTFGSTGSSLSSRMATASQAAARLWQHAGLPNAALQHLHLPGDDPLPSSFLLGAASQATIGCAALAAAQLLALRTEQEMVDVTVPARDAVAEFRSEHVATLDGGGEFEWDALAGQYRTRDGWIRPHTNWRHHKEGFLDLLGLPPTAKKADLAAALHEREADEVAEAAMQRGLVCTAMRSFAEWCAPLRSIRRTAT